jgi:hypothetical protein
VTLFRVEPTTLASPGETVTLEWGTANATAVSIEQVGKGPVEVGEAVATGKVNLTVDDDTVFLITAQGSGGSDLRAASVTVSARARSVLFSAVPSTVEAGGTATLVWNAPGARAVRLEEVGGATLDIGAQLESGSVRVSPKRTTSYRLRADDKVSTTTVRVAPTIVSFISVGPSPAAGEPLTLTWETASATSVSLTRVGLATPLPVPAGQVVTGTFVDTVPAGLPPDGVLTYILEASDGSTRVTQALEVSVGGGVQITTFAAPTHALSGSTFNVTWSTTGGESAELVVDGRRAYLATSRAEVSAGSYALSAPTQSTRVELIVRNARGAQARESRTVQGVGPLALNFFEADRTTIASGGEPVTLRWSIFNARNVRITSNTGAGFFRQFSGNVDSGSLVVLPNGRPGLSRVTYRLEADNGTGSAPIVRTLDIDVTTSSGFTFSRPLPIRAITTVTGTTAPGTTAVRGFKTIERNPGGEAFIDIRRTGTPVTFTGTTNSTNVLLPAPFETTLYGTRLSRSRLNVSRFGWFNLTTSTLAVNSPAQVTPTFGTALEPLTVAPYWQVLATASAQVHWRVDTVPDARRLIVQWTNVRPETGPIDARLTFQAQVYSTGKVVFAYRDFFKVTGTPTVGLVNTSETDELSPTMPVAAGDVWRFFGEQAPPVPFRVEATAFAGSAIVNGEPMEAEGAASIAPGLFNVSEINYVPGPGVTNGQWIEVANNSDAGLDLSGWDVDFGGAATYTIPQGSVVAPFGRLLLGQASDLGDPDDPNDGGLRLTDGGIEPRRPADAIYPATFVPPPTGAFVRLSIAGNEYVRFPPTSTGVLTPSADWEDGRSYQFEDERLPWVTYQSATTRFLCPAIRPAYGTRGQFGSPGIANPSCFPFRGAVAASQAFESLAATGTPVPYVASNTFDPVEDEGLFVLTLAQPIRFFGFFEATELTISSNGFVTPGTFTSTFHGGNKSLPSGTAPVFLLAPFWDDHDGSVNGNSQTYYRVDPNGDVTVSWEHWAVWTSPTSSTITNSIVQDLNFQIVIRANGNVEFRYGTMSGSGARTINSSGNVTGSTGAQLAAGSLATSWIDIGPAATALNINSASPGIQPNSAFFFELFR